MSIIMLKRILQITERDTKILLETTTLWMLLMKLNNSMSMI